MRPPSASIAALTGARHLRPGRATVAAPLNALPDVVACVTRPPARRR
jgi:hypothetical protein